MPPAAAARHQRRQSAIRFSHDLEQTVDEAAHEGLPVIAVFGAVWCPSCRRFEESTLPSPQVQALAGRFLWAEIDVDRQLSLARAYQVDATPTILILGTDGGVRRRLVGFRSPDVFEQELQALLESREGPESGPQPPAGSHHPRTDLTFSPRGYRGRSICFSHVGYGPLEIASQSPFQSLRLSLAPRTPSTLARGQVEIRAAGTWANTWAYDEEAFGPAGDDGSYLLDYESLDADLSVAYGLSDTFLVELEFQDRSRFGGAMDGLIQGFHDLFGIDQSGRDEVPRDQFQILLDRGAGVESVDLGAESTGTFSRNLLLTVQHNITCGTNHLPALSWSLTGRWELESADLEGSGPDVGLSLAAARRFGRFYGYLTLGYAFYGQDSFRGVIDLRDRQFSVLTAFEWRFKPRRSLIFQWLASEAVTDDLGPFSASSHEITLGFKAEVRDRGVLELGLIENTLTADNSPDFGVHLGFSQRL